MQPPPRPGGPSGPAEDSLDRLTRLQSLTAALSQAVTSSQVTDVILTEAFAAFRASAGIVSALTEDGTEFVCLGVLGYPEQVARGWRRLPADHPVPIADAVRDRRPVIISTRQECAARYPALSSVRGAGANGALAALPLLVRGRPVGALGLSFPTDRDFNEQDRQSLLTLAGLCANALERARLYDALRRGEEQFRGAFDAAAIGVAVVAPDGRWLQVNRSLCGIVGYDEQELLGLTFQDITHPDDLDTDLGYVRQMLAGVIPYYHMEKRCLHKQGQVVWVLLSVSLVHDAGGRPLYLIAQVQDVTARKRAEQERESLIRELQDALATVRTLRGLLPVCAWCKNVRNDQGYWKRLEAYLAEQFDVTVTHGMCPACAEKMQEEVKNLPHTSP